MALGKIERMSPYRAAIGTILLVTAMLVACGDDDSDFASRPSDDSSSSVTPKSSSSSKVPNQDGEPVEPAEGSSSCLAISFSSDSDGADSGSSVGQSCLALLEGEDDWSWDVPKECRFNPDISYGSMVDSRDNKTYKTIKVGDQVWMAENLNYADSATTPSLLKHSWCYNNVAENCAVAGRLYTWAAAIDSVALYDGGNGVDCGYGKTCSLPAKVQGVCPDGWHLPTQAEGKTLFTEVGKMSTAGMILKSRTGWWSNGNGTDAYGFSALPAGSVSGGGDFDEVGLSADFWSATEGDVDFAYSMHLNFASEGVGLNNNHKDIAYSVRCLKD